MDIVSHKISIYLNKSCFQTLIFFDTLIIFNDYRSSRVDKLLSALPKIEKEIGYTSYINEHRDKIFEHNERLEFLGDSVLGLIISEHLYRNFPKIPEGTLSDLRSRLVESCACIGFLSKLKISHYLLLGKGERMNDGRGRESILADFFEALIGAIYLDGGIESAKNFFHSHFETETQVIIEQPIHNWKAELQDLTQKKYHEPPLYQVISEEGPSHCKIFNVEVWINNERVGVGAGPSKKAAQQAAAKDALEKLVGSEQNLESHSNG